MITASLATEEQRILEGIKAKGDAARETGLVSTVEPRAGYLVYLRYGEEVNDQVRDFSYKVLKSVSGGILKSIIYGGSNSLIYDGSNAHQTIADYGGINVENIGDFKPDEEVLEKLSGVARVVFENQGRSIPGTAFGKYIHSADSVILTPADSHLYGGDLRDPFEKEANQSGIDVKKGWGRHITVSRFTEDIPAEELEAFNALLHNATCKGDVEPFLYHAESLNVGHITIDKTGFNLHPHLTIEF